jgi:hypothetical protein
LPPLSPSLASIVGISVSLNVAYTVLFVVLVVRRRQIAAFFNSSEPEPTSQTLRTVFISYSRTDGEFVDKLEPDLRQQGFQTWVDRRRLEGGQVWDAEIRDALDNAAVIVLILTPDALKSRWVRTEYEYGIRRRKPIIPVMFYPCPSLPRSLSRLQILDFKVGVNYDDKYRFAIGQLRDALRDKKVPQVPITQAA